VKEFVLGGDVYFGGCCPQGVFRVFIFRCSAYIRRLLFVFLVSPVSVRLEQGSGCSIKFAVSKKKKKRDHISTKFVGNSSPIQHKNILKNLMI
jgi:hypothetical protein